MDKLTILLKNGTVVEQDNVVEHYCTERMFYCALNDGSQFYITLDEICTIQANKIDNSEVK